MIVATDIDFHEPAEPDPFWAETNWFAFCVPEARLVGAVYALSRKEIGCMSTEISVSGAMIDSRSELLYIDSRHHLPAVEKLSDFTTANNLSIKAHSPRDYSIRYEGYDDFSLALDFEGLHEPWDIHDPSMNPLAHGTGTGGMGAAFGGHFEVSGHITGAMKLRGEEYAVDCVETMDHSWGHRPEVFMPTCGWSQAHFGRGLVIKWLNSFDLDAPTEEQQKLHYAYVMEDGKVYGVTAGTFLTQRFEGLLMGMEVSVTDVRGKTYEIRGLAETSLPLNVSAPSIFIGSNMRWSLAGDDRVGYGLAGDFISLQEMSRRHGRRWADLPTRMST